MLQREMLHYAEIYFWKKLLYCTYLWQDL